MFPEGRIFDFVIIGVIALIVVGPKDLPVLMRKVGRFVAHMRSMAAEFRASFDEMARQSELDELRREVEALRSGQSLQTAVGLGPESGVHEVFDDIHSGMRDGEPAPAAPSPVITSPEAPAAAMTPLATGHVGAEPAHSDRDGPQTIGAAR
jgi:sec-independent protein translocase protein TatB